MADKNKLNGKAVALDEESRLRMNQRKKDRYWKAASAAIAAKMRRQLKATDTTRIKLAEALEVTPANITRYLSGDTNFELKTLVQLERALGIEIINRNVIPVKEKNPVVIEVHYESNACGWIESELKKTKYPIYG